MIAELLQAQEDYLIAQFPAVPNIGAYPRLRRKVAIPAVFIELDAMDPEPDKGTEQLHVVGRFRALCVYDETVADSHQQVAALAASVAIAIMRGRKFGIAAAGPARIVRIAPDDFKPELIGYVVWAVEWTHVLEFGESVWDGEGVLPTEVWIGWSPEIGAANIEDYEQFPEVPDVP